MRSFMQPFLILYYTPLIILQSMIGSTSTSNREARQSHELFVEGVKNAVEVAEKVNEGGYWPVHVNGMCSYYLAAFHEHLIVITSTSFNASSFFHFFRKWRNWICTTPWTWCCPWILWLCQCSCRLHGNCSFCFRKKTRVK